jgi:DNA replication protein DnaC
MEIIPAASGMFKLASLPPALDAGLSNEESRRLQKIYNRPPEDYARVCHTCQKAGSFKARYRDQVVMVECNCREQWILSRRLLASGIGDAYQRYSWQHVTGVPDEALMRVRLYMENLPALLNDGLGLILWSPRTGTGKSLMSYLILKEALAQGYTGYFTSFADMLDHHMAGWSDPETRAWFTKAIEHADVLVIDELGKENPGRHNVVDELLDRVVRSRIAHNRATIIPTNLEPSRGEKAGDDFGRYQRGLLDLLMEASITVEVSGDSFRDQRRSQRVDDALSGIRYPVVIR